jgi:hypothetical protein
MSSRKLVSFCSSIAAIALCFAGCRGGSHDGKAADEGSSDYAELTRCKATQNESLQGLLLALEKNEQFPKNWTSQPRTVAGKKGHKRHSRSWLADDQNFAVTLSTIGPESKSSFKREFEKLGKLFEAQAIPWSREAIERVESILVLRRSESSRIRDALDLPGSDFGMRIDEGILADVDAVRRAMFAGRLLATGALFEVRQGELDAAIVDLRRLLHLAQGLSEEPHLVPRIAAARVREEAFIVMQAACNSPNLNVSQLKRLQQDVAATIGQWQDDSLVWSGERAQGLHAYEMARAGEVLSLLKDEEMADARARGLKGFSRSIVTNIDADQHFYLASMAAIIDSCAKPYYERKDEISVVFRDMERLSTEAEPAWLAENVLLGHIKQGMYWQAHDRALSHAWFIALTNACESPVADDLLNPLTGTPFQVAIDGANVSIWGISDPEGGWGIAEPLTVPKLTQVARRPKPVR